jgi:hypothetical protein
VPTTNDFLQALVLLVFLGLGVGIYFLTRAVKRKSRANFDALPPEVRELRLARQEYAVNTKTAEKIVQVEHKAIWSRINEAEKQLVQATNYGTHKLASYGGVTLTETGLSTKSGWRGLSSDTKASVEVAGNFAVTSRSTFTRIAAGGLLFGAAGAVVGGVAKKNKTLDKRELYLLIEGTDFSEILTCNPDHGQEVRQFAASIRQVCLNSEAVLNRRTALIQEAEETLSSVKADTNRLDGALQNLALVKANTARLAAAESAVEATQSGG